MTAEEFRQRMNGDIGAVIERFEQDRGRDGIVDDEWHAVAMRDFRQRLDVTDIAGGIADGFGKNRLGVLVDQLLDRIGLVAVGKAGGDALARQYVREQGVRGAVELRNGDDVAAGVGEIDQREMQRRLSGGDRECADAAFEVGNALLENRGGRIGDPAVAVAFGFEVEQCGAVIGAVERIGHRLVDRNSDGLGRRIGIVAGVNCDRFVAHCATSAYAFRDAFFSPVPVLEARGQASNNSRQH